MAGLAELAASREILVIAGSGGVGKTTVAAGLAAQAAAEIGGSVLVLTVDPARRLATALGLEPFGNEVIEVPVELFMEAGVAPRGSLHAAMLDTRTSWDDLIGRHAPDVRTEQAILANPLYQDISGTFVQSHDYVAMEALYALHGSGRYDLIVVDTPPARRAIDFLDAPARMADFFGSPLLRWLTVPARSRLAGAAYRPFQLVADRVLGAQFLADIAEFFLLFQSMYDGFVERATSVSALLEESRTSFVVVTALEEAQATEAGFLCDELERRGLDLGAIVANRVLPSGLVDEDAAAVARRIIDSPGVVMDRLQGDVGELEHIELVLAEMADSYLRYRTVAIRAEEVRGRLTGRSARQALVPLMPSEVTDLARLLEIGNFLWRSPQPLSSEH